MNNKNICAKISFLCVSLITLILTLDFQYELMPFNSVFLLLYVILVLFVTIWISFVTLQHILNQNKPFTLDDSTLPGRLATRLKTLLIGNEAILNVVVEKNEVNIDRRIEMFVGDVEALFVRRWYVQYISRDETFLVETRGLLDVIVRRFLQIGQQINTDKIVHGTLIILLKHVKEYRKAVKKVKGVGGSVERHYRYSHVGSKSAKALEHFTLQITSKLLRHFINWELYNSLACRCVTSILAKKLLTYLLIYTSAPGFINYKVLLRAASESQKEQVDLEKYAFISVSDVDHAEIVNMETQEELEEMTANEESVEEKSEDKDAVDAVDGIEEDCIDIVDIPEQSTTPISSAKERAASEPVKIHESRSTNKTWRNSRDLDCISLGQDILYLSDITESDAKKLWKRDSDSLEAEEARPLAVVKENVHEEVDTFGVFLEQHKPNLPQFLRPATTGCATANTIKEFQQTTANNVAKVSQATSNAVHKIGDLQDEAAGVVEGIFDFGMAGLRKGLRLTGLQDDIQETIPQRVRSESAKRDIPIKTEKLRLTKLGHVNSDEENAKKEESWEDNVWVNPLLNNSNSSPSFEGDILLERSPIGDSRSFSSDSKNSDVPTMEVIVSAVDSPVLEYEDTTDLATTTAKLRSLLAQKQESAINTPVASPMSLVPTPIDPSGSSLEELSDVDGALPSMYKTWAKTATGVLQNTLNTIKTALPGNTNEHEGVVGASAAARLASLETGEKKWLFVQADSQPNDLSSHMEKFLMERRVFCTVDNAYEAIEAVDIADQLDSSLIMSQRQFDDELDDFDTTVPMTKALTDLICELIEDTYPPLVKENVVKVILLVSGRLMEESLHEAGKKLPKVLNNFIGKLPKFEANPLTMPMKIETMIEMSLNIVPNVLGKILNKGCLKSITGLLLESLQSHKINQDTNLQLLELFTSEIIAAAAQSSPTYSA